MKRLVCFALGMMISVNAFAYVEILYEGTELPVIITDSSDGTQSEVTTNADFTTNLDGSNGSIVAASLYGRVDNDTLVPIKLDASTQDIQIIEHEHAEIHSGEHYFICNHADFTNGASTDFAVSVPDNDKNPHMSFAIEGSYAVHIDIYEGSDYDADGTPVSSFNNDRNSTNTSNLTISTDPTINSIGNLIFAQIKGANKQTGLVERDREIILKRDTYYIFRITNGSTSTNTISWCAEWYEHTPKN